MGNKIIGRSAAPKKIYKAAFRGCLFLFPGKFTTLYIFSKKGPFWGLKRQKRYETAESSPPYSPTFHHRIHQAFHHYIHHPNYNVHHSFHHHFHRCIHHHIHQRIHHVQILQALKRGHNWRVRAFSQRIGEQLR